MIADAIREMTARGLSAEDIAAIVEAYEFEEPAAPDPKARRRARNARYRDRRKPQSETPERLKTSHERLITPETPERLKPSQNVSNETLGVSPLARARTRVDANSPELELSGKRRKKDYLVAKRLNKTSRAVLLECLSAEVADAVLAHRRALRKPLTVRAAQLLAKGFTATGDPSAAADMMIARGWQGFKPEWFDNERADNGRQKATGKGSLVEAGRRLTERLVAERREREMRAGTGGDAGDEVVRLLPGLGRQRP